MKTIARSLQANDTVGNPIPIPFPKLERHLQLHTKELTLVAGAPAAGKSVFAINLAMNQQDPVLYLAQDSAPSVFARATAYALHMQIADVYTQLRDEESKHTLIERMRNANPNLFVHAGALTVQGIEDRVVALTELLGKAPPLIIVDNLIDTLVPGMHHQEVGFYASTLNEFKQLALRHNTCVMALHHVTRRGGENGTNPHGLGTRRLRMTDLLYSGEREAEHVLGVYHNQGKDRIVVQILKQRDGDADPEGHVEVPLTWKPRFGRLEKW